MSTTDASTPSIQSTLIDKSFHSGTHTFHFPNGDVYEGEYMAHVQGLVWREGMGTYTTNDGQKYTGKWYNDKLVEDENLDIIYADGSEYHGTIKENRYNGAGEYITNNLHLICDFKDNKPNGDVTMLCSDGKIWVGSAGEEDCLILPQHVFFEDISSDLGKVDIRKSEPIKQSISPNQTKILKEVKDEASKTAMRRMEEKIFAKTKKTISDLRFEKSDWYQSYKRFKDTFDDISSKIKTNGLNSLDSHERIWHESYLKFREKYREIMESRKKKFKLPEYDLLELFRDEKFRMKCPPVVNVIYPSEIE